MNELIEDLQLLELEEEDAYMELLAEFLSTGAYPHDHTYDGY